MAKKNASHKKAAPVAKKRPPATRARQAGGSGGGARPNRPAPPGATGARRPSGKPGGGAARQPERPRPVPVTQAPDEPPAPQPAPEDDEQRDLPPFLVVGIGASAGGLEACTQFLAAVPAHTGMAFVLVQHLAPKHSSMLPGLLSGQSAISVVQAQDRMKLVPNRLHIIPPDTQMAVANGMLHLTARPEGRVPFTPIDVFFRSLAEYAQSRAVGIVLSGTASDGAFGLREIKGAGGITFAQAPESAKYDGMPLAAIATGAVDLVLPPEEIASELARIARHSLARRPDAQAPALDASGKSDDLSRIFTLLRAATGVDFTHYKQPTINRRLHRRMLLHKIEGLPAYVKYLQENPPEVINLYQDMLIHVTRFFREAESYAALTEKVFPALMQNRRPDSPVRVWVPGCSTGEEAYSIAIALMEFLGDHGAATPIQLFATDISEGAIEHARAGVYSENISSDVSPERLRRFFSRVDGKYRIAKSVRDLCVFARQDLTRDPPLSRLDLIVCRNVLIYLGPVLQKKLMGVFHYALKPKGYLMLGAAETIGKQTDLFSSVDKRHRLYVKNPSRLPAIPAEHVTTAEAPSLMPHSDRRLPPAAAAAVTVQTEANRAILSRYAPPGVIVDNDFMIVHFRGQTGPFLEPAPGEASLNLLKMAREGLLYALRSALLEARKTEGPVRREGLKVNFHGRVHDVNVEVIPLTPAGGVRHFLVLFEDMLQGITAGGAEGDELLGEKTAPGAGGGGAKQKKSRGADNDASVQRRQDPALARRVRHLQEELAASRDYLQSIIQDLEATNEELQSANEEILSSNEELQSTNEELDTAKEELQSTNEELNTINEELSGRNDELSHVNSDLINLLASVQIAIVMVTGDLRIRRFTPMAERVLNLIPGDVGRPISNIKPNIQGPDLEKLIAEAIDSITIKEQEVRDRHGNWYLLRVRPYKNIENKIDGAVLALFDIGDQKRRSLEGPGLSDPEVRDLAWALADVVHEPLAVLDGNLTVRKVNRAFRQLFQVTDAETEGKRIYELGSGQWNVGKLRVLLEDVLPGHNAIEGYEIEHNFPALGVRTISVGGRRIERSSDQEALILLSFHDITSVERAREKAGAGAGAGAAADPGDGNGQSSAEDPTPRTE